MTEYTVVSRERHAGKCWQRPGNYTFASQDPVVSLVSQEVPRAMMFMAIAFIESPGTCVPVGVQGLKQGQNKLVSKDGRWLTDYVPAVYRTYPFRLAHSAEGTEVLCIDEAAAKVAEGNRGEPFFAEDGKPTQVVTEVLTLLVHLEKEHQVTQKACAALVRHALLEPWPLQVKEGEQAMDVGGLSRIAEAKLQALDAAALADVRDAGALMLAYGQLFSMQQAHLLGKISAQAAASGPPALKLFDNNGVISFANL